ncbi:MAG: PQQ-binding-like beta-propeller repeat protein [Mariprofundaceae bacterium]|nr:PQQ-binding-like beta-propeller repeat protein [Mariprofundaceae bacterium]
MLHDLIRRSGLLLLAAALSSCASLYGGDGAEQATFFSSTRAAQKAWSVDVDQRKPGEPAGFSQPAVVAAGNGSIVIAGRDARVRVYGFNGSELHRIAIDEPSDSCALALPNGTVIVGDVGGMLYGIDPVKGSILWRYQLSSPYLSHPVLLQDGFLIQTSDNRLYRFSADGKKQWSYAGHGGGLSIYLTASPLVVDSTLYAVFSNGDAVALKIDSGDLLWRRQLLLNADAPVLSELRAPIADPVLLKQGRIGIEKLENVILVGFYQGDLLILSASDGRQLFSKEVSIKSAPLIDRGQLYIATASGELESVDLATGATRWKQKLTDGELLGPVLWKDSLWLADDRGAVLCVGRNGEKCGKIAFDSRIERMPIVTPAGVLVRTELGVLTLIR